MYVSEDVAIYRMREMRNVSEHRSVVQTASIDRGREAPQRTASTISYTSIDREKATRHINVSKKCHDAHKVEYEPSNRSNSQLTNLYFYYFHVFQSHLLLLPLFLIYI